MELVRNNFPEPTANHMPIATLLIDLHYLPSLEYFACLLPYTTIRLEAQETYQKQTYRNRCYILTSQQVDRLTVPVCKSNKKNLYKMLKIDYSQPWSTLHWRAICTAYSRAPYFEYFAEHFHTIFSRRYTYLFDLNLALLKTCLQLLQLDKQLTLSEYYEKEPAEHLVDVRSTIFPSNRQGTSSYYRSVCYHQVFGHAFFPNLSIVDLLFCEGYNALPTLKKSLASKIANE